jgi:tetratricopeptide (TPR) repeat protein
MLTGLALILSCTICFAQPAAKTSKANEAKMMSLLDQAKAKVAEARQFANAGDFAKAADSYSAAITSFDGLSNSEEIELSFETLTSLLKMRAAVYVGAKKYDLADADYKKAGNMYVNQTKAFLKLRKTKAVALNDQFMAEDYLRRALNSVVNAFAIEKSRAGAYEATKNPLSANDHKIFSADEIKEFEALTKEILLDWARIETARFIRLGQAEHAAGALEKLDFVIKLAPNTAEAYKLRARIYRQQNNPDLAIADETKAKELSL